MKQAQLVNMKTTKTVKAPKKASKRVSAGMKIKNVAEITWIKDDNCCLLFAIWETLTQEQRSLLTVRYE